MDALEQRLFELARDALVVTALDGAIRRVNRAGACDWLGLSEDERLVAPVLGRSSIPPTTARSRAQHEELRRDGHDRDARSAAVLRADGSVRWAEVRAVARPGRAA